MFNRTTIILVIVACMLGGYIWFFERTQLSTEQREREGIPLFRVQSDDIERVELVNGEGRIVCVKETDGSWRMEEPVVYSADESQMQSICTRLANLTSERRFNSGGVGKEKLEEFGLDEPRVTVSFVERGTERVFSMGKETPLGSEVYLRVKGEKDIHLVSRGIFTALNKEAEDLRDKSVIDFELEELTGFSISCPDSSLEFARKDDAWWIRTPLEGLADPDTVSGFLRKVKYLRVREFVADKPENLNAYGLDAPSCKVTLWAGGDEAIGKLLFGKEGDDNTVYLTREDANTIFLVRDNVLEDCARDMDGFRDKKVTHLSAGTIDRLEITRENSRILFEEQGDQWEILEPEESSAENNEVRELIRTIVSLEAKSFLQVAEEDTAAYGFGGDEIIITLTPDSGNAEVIRVGGAQGSDAHVMRDGEGEILVVDAGFLDEIRFEPLSYRKKEVLDFRVDEVSMLTVTRMGEEPVLCEKQEDGEWQVVEPARAPGNSANITAICAGLSHLRAQDFIVKEPETLVPYGLDSPALRVTMGIDKVSLTEEYTLLVGKEAGDATYYAMCAGDPVVFTIPSYVENNLRRELRAEEDSEGK